jgi:hypothetical protein
MQGRVVIESYFTVLCQNLFGRIQSAVCTEQSNISILQHVIFFSCIPFHETDIVAGVFGPVSGSKYCRKYYINDPHHSHHFDPYCSA